MKCTIPEISWHNREPVLSVDIHPVSYDNYRLATSGGDSHVLIWQMSLNENGAVKQEVVSDLTRHQKAVNVVRWSPSGQYLASADDDANIIIWQLKTDNIPLLEGDSDDKEIWIVYKVLRGHKEDIYDLCWSVDGLKLFSGSIDNTAILWDLSKGKMDHILSDHKGFVQGVAWDPKDQLIATISTDRICRIFNTTGKRIKARLHKGHLPVSPDHYLSGKEVKYFHDDTFKSFFRRLQFSPDGSLLVVPSGHIEIDDCKKTLNATLVFTLNNIYEPAAVLPLQKQSSTVVKFCPILFELREDGPTSLVNLPYRMIFAVGTDHDVILYDTQQQTPFARLQEIHYTRLTDLTWSSDGRLLIASSTDGFCALITFDVDELGVKYVKADSKPEENVMDISGCEELEKDETEENVKEIKVEEKKRPSFIEQWASKTPKRIKLDDKKTVTKETNGVIEIIDDEDDAKDLPNEIREEINKLIPRRATSKIENNKTSDKSVAKPIAVRRKPKPEEPAIGGAKPIEVRKKPRDTVEDFKENKAVNEPTVNVTVKNSTETQEKTTSVGTKQSEKVIEIENGSSTDQQSKVSKSQKSKDAPKIKVSSLVKKKETPSKTNPLLKFLKNSSGKTKKTKKDLPTSVDLTLDEEEARDAWKCEKDAKEANGGSKTDSNSEPMEEDCTEDFCLQLEDSQVSEKTQNETKTEKPAIVISENKKTDTLCNKPDIIEQKKPRRVALITLTSPKGKKKP